MVSPHIRVLVVSDVRLYRDGITSLLAAQSGARISGSGGPLEAVIEAIEHRAPDVVLLDAALPDGPAVTRAIRARTPRARVVAIAVSDGDLLRFAEAGIAGYVPPDASTGDVLAAIASVERGEALCSPRAAAALLDRVAALAPGAGRGGRVADRARARDLRPDHRRPLQQGDRDTAVHRRADGQDACPQHPAQARREPPRPGRRAGARRRRRPPSEDGGRIPSSDR